MMGYDENNRDFFYLSDYQYKYRSVTNTVLMKG